MKDPKNIQPFEELSLPRKDKPAALNSRYRVYKDSTNYVLVEAASAAAALKASGLTKARRIEPDAAFFRNVLNKEKAKLPANAAGEMLGQEVPPIEEKPQAAEQEETAALSNGEVDKLLQE